MNGRRPSWWHLAAALAVLIALLDLMQAVRGMTALAVFAAGFASLGLAGWRWGTDSRDGADWRRTDPWP